MSFGGKVALITGASSGIGADAARHLSQLGAKVAIVGRNTERLDAIAEQIRNAGSPTPLAITADIGADSARIIDETVQHFGQLDILVNNAGISALESLEHFQLETFDRIFRTNLRAAVQLTKLAIPHLERTRGNVVNVSSLGGHRPAKDLLVYSMAKSGLNMFTQYAAVELGPKGIRVNAISPGVVKTSIFETMGIRDELLTQFYQAAAAFYPVGRIADVSDTSNAIAFLASEQSSFINGAILLIDGGSIHSETMYKIF